MPDKSSKNREEIQLEDLLRLKQAERPPDEFWDTFDRELEKRRLQVLVRRNHWYSRWTHEILVHLNPMIALGAASIFILGLALYFNGLYFRSEVVLPHVDTDGSAPVAFRAPAEQAGPARNRDGRDDAARRLTDSVVSRADFGVDVIAPKPQTYRFRAFTTDMAPASFKVSREQTAVYSPDELRLDRSSTGAILRSPLY